MSATAAQIARVRRMVAEPTEATYDDALITEYIERRLLVDERGAEPYTWDDSTEPPTAEDNGNWIPTYDLNAAAADIWDEKAALVAADFDFSADGGSYTRSQKLEACQQQARYFRARRAIRVILPRPYPSEPDEDVWIGNRAEAS